MAQANAARSSLAICRIRAMCSIASDYVCVRLRWLVRSIEAMASRADYCRNEMRETFHLIYLYPVTLFILHYPMHTTHVSQHAHILPAPVTAAIQNRS